jgi:HAD superfamily hydrolase (TIGR01490 family)
MNVFESNVAAFFDMDYTLYKKYLWQALFAHHQKNKFKRRLMYAFVAFHFPLWLFSKIKIFPQDFFYKMHATNLAWLVRGVSIERGDNIWDWIIQNEIIPHLRPEMVEAIKNHRSKGHRIILISGSFTPLLDKLVGRLNIDGAIATPLESKNGIYTGKIIPPINIGHGKVGRLKHFLSETGKQIDLEKSYFYTDSIADEPVMNIFGHPVAVYPDLELARLAADQGWPVIGDNPANGH